MEPGATMAPEMSEPAAASAGARRRWVAVAGFVVGVLLLVAAVVVVSRRGEVSSALASLERAGWETLAALALLPVANWVLTSAVFGVLTRRFGRVGWVEMGALIGSAWLLNLLPLRPGMVGRVTYHKVVNQIRVRDSAWVLVMAMLCTGGAAMVMVGCVFAATWVSPGLLVWAAAGPLAVMVVATLVLARTAGGAGGAGWRIAAAFTLRYVDCLVWAVRYWLVFGAIGRPITPAAAAIIAAASQASMAVPVQVGVREWIVGLAAGLLPHWMVGTAGRSAGGAGGVVLGASAPGLTADLVNRACELVVLVPVGLGCTLWLWVRRPGARARGTGGAGTTVSS